MDGWVDGWMDGGGAFCESRRKKREGEGREGRRSRRRKEGDVFAAEKVRARGLLARARREGNGMGVRSAYDIARRVCTQPGQGLNSNWSGIRLGKVGR